MKKRTVRKSPAASDVKSESTAKIDIVSNNLGKTAGSAYKSAYAQDKKHMRKIASAKKRATIAKKPSSGNAVGVVTMEEINAEVDRSPAATAGTPAPPDLILSAKVP